MSGRNEATIAFTARPTGASGDVEDEPKWLTLRCAITKNASVEIHAIAPRLKQAHGKAGLFLAVVKVGLAHILFYLCRIPAKQVKRRIGDE